MPRKLKTPGEIWRPVIVPASSVITVCVLGAAATLTSTKLGNRRSRDNNTRMIVKEKEVTLKESEEVNHRTYTEVVNRRLFVPVGRRHDDPFIETLG
jgi:hypothetical protein